MFKTQHALAGEYAASGRDFFGARAKLRIGEQRAEAGFQLFAVQAGLLDPEFGDGITVELR